MAERKHSDVGFVEKCLSMLIFQMMMMMMIIIISITDRKWNGVKGGNKTCGRSDKVLFFPYFVP